MQKYINKEYKYNDKIKIWHKEGYTGINYSDGNNIENEILSILKNTSDISVLSDELRLHCTDWVKNYHFSALRSNLFEPFKKNICSKNILEIGSGCGAITRCLGEYGGNVLALEGSLRRAEITRERCRDLDNVHVLSDNFNEFISKEQFDVITLIGVFEYAALFLNSENPQYDFLQRVRKLLKPDGILILAIENQLGLKYIAGAPEDHLGLKMSGVENRYSQAGVRTFGKQELSKLLDSVGLHYQEFFAPYPDYKLPTAIISTDGFQDNEFDPIPLITGSINKDPQIPKVTNFSLDLSWPVIVGNGLGMDLSNSFLIACKQNDSTVKSENILAWKFSKDRKKEFCKVKKFIKRENNIVVESNLFNKAILQTAPNEFEFKFEDTEKYIKGKTLIQVITEKLSNINNENSLNAVVNYYVDALKSLSNNTGTSNYDFIENSMLSGDFLDCLPSNIIINNNQFHYIDREWSYKFEIPSKFIIYRFCHIMHQTLESESIDGNTNWYDFVKNIFNFLNIEITDSEIDFYITTENDFQNFVNVQQNNRENCIQWMISPLSFKDYHHKINIKYASQINHLINLLRSKNQQRNISNELQNEVGMLNAKIKELTLEIIKLKSSSYKR